MDPLLVPRSAPRPARPQLPLQHRGQHTNVESDPAVDITDDQTCVNDEESDNREDEESTAQEDEEDKEGNNQEDKESAVQEDEEDEEDDDIVDEEDIDCDDEDLGYGDL